MSRSLANEPSLEVDEKVLSLESHQQGLDRVPARMRDAVEQRWIFNACVLYECTSELIITDISPNVFSLLRIHPENVLGKRLMSEERISTSAYNRLLARFEQRASASLPAIVHKIADDQGLPVWVAHTIRKSERGPDTVNIGCLIPLVSDFSKDAIDSSTISQFVHQIGNHFQLINLLTNSLKRAAAETDEALEALQQAVERAIEFTRSFSHLSQPLGCATTIDLRTTLCSVVKSVGSEFADKEVILQNVETAPPVDTLLVCGDASLLESAFGAIIRNSLEATKCGGQVRVSIGIEREHAVLPALARISVSDGGCGIEPSMLTKVTDPFITSKRERNGLGLSTAVRNIELHGGALKIASVWGQGTEVQVLLPVTHVP